MVWLAAKLSCASISKTLLVAWLRSEWCKDFQVFPLMVSLLKKTKGLTTALILEHEQEVPDHLTIDGY